VSNATTTQIVEASFVAGASSARDLPPATLAEVAFGGRSNVGKSSLLNAITERRKLVRAGGKPGTTRAINLFLVRAADGLAVHLVDLPGYGYAQTSKSESARWGPLIEGYFRARLTLRALVVLVDVRRGMETDDADLIEYARGGRAPAGRLPLDVILVATKTDKISRSARKPALARIRRQAGIEPIGFSAVTGEGSGELWRALRATICRTS
jgi:GTP-binding protein